MTILNFSVLFPWITSIDITHTHIYIYTDGSRAENLVAAAYTIPTLNLKKQLRLCNSSSKYAAELTATKEACLWISENEKQNLKNCAIFSDSLSVLMSIKNSFSQSRPNIGGDL